MQPETSDEQTPQPGWQFNPGESPAKVPAAVEAPKKKKSGSKEESISWTASEFIDHEKKAGWYFVLALATVGIAILVFVLTRDKISTAMVFVVGIAMGVIGARKPRTMQYQLDVSGVHIGQKSYPFSEFKYYSVMDEGGVSSINLLPMKRFMPSISIYYEPADEDRITDFLNDYLPFQETQKDPIDRFMHRIRF